MEPTPNATHHHDHKERKSFDLSFGEFVIENFSPNCTEQPDYVRGEFWGHFYPASLLMVMAAYQYYVLLSRYYRSIAKGSTYQFNGRLNGMASAWWPSKLFIWTGVAPLFLLSIVVDFIVHASYLGGFWNTLTYFAAKNGHTPIHAMFVTWGIVELFERCKRIHIPRGLSQLTLAFAFAETAGVGLTHLVKRCELDVSFHRMLCVAATGAAIAIVAQMAKPNNFLLSAASTFFIFMNGLWLLTTGIYAWVLPAYPGGSWNDMSHDNKLRAVPRKFFAECAILHISMLLLFIIFGFVRGRRLGAANPHYDLNEEDVDSRHSSLNGSVAYHVTSCEESPLLIGRSEED